METDENLNSWAGGIITAASVATPIQVQRRNNPKNVSILLAKTSCWSNKTAAAGPVDSKAKRAKKEVETQGLLYNNNITEKVV
jgi:hypothetical protein